MSVFDLAQRTEHRQKFHIDRETENAYLADKAIEFARLALEPKPDVDTLRALAGDIMSMARPSPKRASQAGLSVAEIRRKLLQRWNEGRLKDDSTGGTVRFDINGKALR